MISIEKYLKDAIRKELNEVVPQLSVLRRGTRDTPGIDYDLNVTPNGRGSYYVVATLHFSRLVVVAGNKKTISAITWFDRIPLVINGDPTDKVGELARIQARKFAAVWRAVADVKK